MQKESKGSLGVRFLYWLITVVLFVTGYSFVALVYYLLDRIFGASPSWSGDSWMRWHVAALIVAFPVFLALVTLLGKQEQDELAKKKYGCFVLFVISLMVFFSLINLLNHFLDDSLTRLFLLKTVSLYFVAAFIGAYYYFSALRPYFYTQKDNRIFLIIATLSVAFIAIYGVVILKTPPKAPQVVSSYATSFPPLQAKDLPMPESVFPYCVGRTLKVSAAENQVIQKLVLEVEKQTGCVVGNNCLLKWKAAESGPGAFNVSTAWKSVCRGGAGTTFRCTYHSRQICCSADNADTKVCGDL